MLPEDRCGRDAVIDTPERAAGVRLRTTSRWDVVLEGELESTSRMEAQERSSSALFSSTVMMG